MSYQTITNAEILSGAPIDQNLLGKIKTNFEAQQSELAFKQDIINRTVPVGTYIQSDLTLTQFLSETPGQWMLANGQSCAGTHYALLTGKSNVPDLVTDGAFLRQAKAGRALGSSEGDAIRNITGSQTGIAWKTGAVGAGGTGAFQAFTANGNGSNTLDAANTAYFNFDASRVVPTADENRPKNVAVNYYIKVGY